MTRTKLYTAIILGVAAIMVFSSIAPALVADAFNVKTTTANNKKMSQLASTTEGVADMTRQYLARSVIPIEQRLLVLDAVESLDLAIINLERAAIRCEVGVCSEPKKQQ